MDEEKEPIKLGIREVFIVLAIIAIVILVFNSSYIKERLFGIVVDSDEEIDEDYYSYEAQYEELEESDEVLDCFELTVSKIEDSDVVAVLKSTSAIPLSNLELHIIFYDGNKRPIAVETEYIDCILPEGKWVGTLYDVNQKYETYDFLVEANNYNVIETAELYRKVSINQVFGSDTNMSVRFENKTGKKIDASAIAIYYDKNGNICDTEKFYVFDLKPNKTEDVESYKYLDFQKEENSGVEIILTDFYAD